MRLFIRREGQRQQKGGADEEVLLDWLCAEIFDHEQHPERLRELIRAECRTRRIEGPDDIAALIDPRQSWENYIEAHFGSMRRLADYYLNKAPTLDEMKKAHRKFIRDYNTQIHFAHRERQDHRHSPQDVLRGVLACTVPAPTLARIFFATQFTRHLDRSGYIRFRRWRFYAEAGRARAGGFGSHLHQHAQDRISRHRASFLHDGMGAGQ